MVTLIIQTVITIKKVNYSKGEDKIKKEKITKVSQLCGDPKFNEIMEGARSDIRSEAINRKYTIDNFIKKIWLCINRCYG